MKKWADKKPKFTRGIAYRHLGAGNSVVYQKVGTVHLDRVSVRVSVEHTSTGAVVYDKAFIAVQGAVECRHTPDLLREIEEGNRRAKLMRRHIKLQIDKLRRSIERRKRLRRERARKS